MKSTLFTILLSVTAVTVVAAEERAFNYVPKGGYKATTDAIFVDSSIRKKLKPEQKIAELTKRNFAGETITQKLTERSYFVQTGFYSTIFYVGDKGVLVLDPIGYGASSKVVKEIRKVTDKPVVAVVYSHQHEDHIGDINVYLEMAKNEGIDLRIIATDKTASAMKAHGSKLPTATELVSFENGKTKFENITLEVKGFAPAAHSDDAAVWLLKEERVAHIPDLINPDQMPYLSFGGSRTYHGYRENMMTLDAMAFDFFSGGHGNIGGHKDIKFMLSYLDALEAETLKAMQTTNPGDFFIAKYNNHQASAHAWSKAKVKKVMDALRPIYGEFYGFEASVPYQILMVEESFH